MQGNEEWENVLRVIDYWDEPILGLTKRNGRLSIFVKEFDDCKDEYSDHFRIYPVDFDRLDIIATSSVDAISDAIVSGALRRKLNIRDYAACIFGAEGVEVEIALATFRVIGRNENNVTESQFQVRWSAPTA